MTQQTVEPCRHEDVIARYDHYSCASCGAYQPDHTGRRGTAAEPGEWFPSRDAFEHFKRTGVRAWNTRPEDSLIKEAVEALTYLEAEARRFAEFYPEARDGRNTFVIFADKIADRITKLTGEKQ